MGNITNTLRKVLDRKEWEMMTPLPSTTVDGAFTMTDPSGEDKAIVYVKGSSSIWRYDHFQDSSQQLPNSGIAGTFGLGACGTFHHCGPSGTATAGTTSTITTNLTINRSLAGYKIRITSGPGAGNTRTILSNTYGANSVITVTSNFSATITTSSVYQLYTGRYWFFNPGAGTVGFSYYDRALNTWTSRSVTNIPTTWATDGRLINTFSQIGDTFATGTATSATATTLVNSAKTWAVDQWINFQVRIVSGTGAGQIRTITDSDATSLTVATWTINPDATSAYEITGNDDNLYLIGNAALTLYKYSISGNSWAVVSPAVARGAVTGGGCTGNWVSGVSDSAAWSNESAIINGRRIYSLRGGASALLDYYDIPSNSWVAVTYWPQVETFTAGSCGDYDGDNLYFSKEASGRIFRYIISENRLIPWSALPYPHGTAVTGDKMWIKSVTDGTNVIKWIYHVRHSGTELFRCMMIDADI